MLLIDASVIIAILAPEEDREHFLDRLHQHGGPYYVSPVVRMEATLVLAQRLAGKNKPTTHAMFDQARRHVAQFIADLECRETMISGDVGDKALDAAYTYGAIINHPADLNMGDCYAYACARAYRLKIAFKGNDFTHTDLGWPTH